MKIFIKYMVSIRCKMIVKSELDTLGITYGAVDLGEVDIISEITPVTLEKLKLALAKSGLELMDNKKAILIQKIKNLVVEMVHYQDESLKMKNSVYISQKLNYDYTYLANIFSEATGITIEHYIIIHKVERIKELLVYDELNITEISYKLHYSSVAHLSAQFKRITGLTPTFFKNLKNKKRINLEDI
ncbi:MAG TPA: AraC family transcriptional regulator [Flavobacterium sp.]|nr:AraC family transcriptional regulator [Flavobacterium sp.]